MLDRDRFHYIVTLERHRAATYLRSIADGLEGGSLSFSAAEADYQVLPEGPITVGITARAGAHVGFIDLELSWGVPDAVLTNGLILRPELAA